MRDDTFRAFSLRLDVLDFAGFICHHGYASRERALFDLEYTLRRHRPTWVAR